jgi:arginyl-tRNA---protein transferase
MSTVAGTACESSSATAATVEEAPAAPPRHNVVRLCGVAWAPCGYCKGARAHLSQMNQRDDPSDGSASTLEESADEVESSKSYSVVASHLSPALYEQFLESGWRRSGVALYKPLNFESCCPALTIRLDVRRYQPTKSQRKVAKQMAAILRPEEGPSVTTTTTTTAASSSDAASHGKRIKTLPEMAAKTLEPWVERQLHQSGFLEKLTMWTKEALEQVRENEKTKSTTTNGRTVPPLPVICYKIKPPSHRAVRSSKPQTDGVTVDLVSTVCAAVAGQSHGQFDRASLAQRVVQLLREHVAAELRNGQHGSSAAATADHVILVGVDCHVASGHVLVQVKVPTPNNGPAALAGMASVGESNGAHRARHHQSTTTALPRRTEDRFRTWWNATYRSGSPPLPPYALSVSTVSAHESALDPRVHQLYWDYQHAVHQDPHPLQETEPTQEVPDAMVNGDHDASLPSVSSSDHDTESPASWGCDHAPLGWQVEAMEMLTREYSHLPPSRRARVTRAYASFYEFLVENPFHVDQDQSNGSACTKKAKEVRFGTYHQHYTMSGDLLVAVGVVDVLPSGLSSVYLFYSPSFAHQLVPLGKYAILKEIEWTRQSGLPNYYLGYYIESCPKMVYKGDYHPSQLLCPTTKRWVDAEEAISILRKESPLHHCCTLYKQPVDTRASPYASNGAATDAADPTDTVSNIKMDVGIPALVSLSMLHGDGQALVRPFLLDFASQAGPDIAAQCTVSFR